MSRDPDYLAKYFHTTSEKTEAYKQYLLESIRDNRIDPRRVAMAAALGDPVSSSVGFELPKLPEHYTTRLEVVTKQLTHREAVAFASECARRCLTAWESVFPNDPRPRQALDAADLWLLGKTTEVEVSLAAKEASAARIAADDPDKVPGDPALTAAVHSADAASNTALAAADAAYIAAGRTLEIGSVEECVAYAARCAALAAANADGERKWQTDRLIAYLLHLSKPPEIRSPQDAHGSGGSL